MPVLFSTLPEGKEFKEVDLEGLQEYAEKLLKAIGRKDLTLSVVLTDDETIRELNRKWRKKDKPTDVLSFPQDFPEREFPEEFDPEGFLKEIVENCRGCKLLGDVVISVERAKEQAKLYGWSLDDELKRLLLHGFVHLLGLDHERDETQKEKFEAIEKLIGEKVGQT
jgi:probable rRNA maturation factor